MKKVWISMGFNLLKKDKASKATETVSLEKETSQENEVQETQEESYSIVEENKEALAEDEKVQVKDKKLKNKRTKSKENKENSKESRKIRNDKIKKMFNKQTFAIVSAVGTLLVVIIYVFVYLDFSEKTQTLELSNRKLAENIKQLEEYDANKAQYEQDIEDYTNAINEIMGNYPADVREEDIIMLAVQIQQNNEIAYNNIKMEDTENVYTVSKDVVQPAGIEEFDKDIIFERKLATYSNTTDYGNLKGCIEQIFNSDNRIAINQIIYTKNKETGKLEGNIDLKFYCAKGTQKEYTVPDIKEYISGTSDFFKSGSVNVTKTENTDEEGSDSNEDSGEVAVEE